jgi:hypothetical protein
LHKHKHKGNSKNKTTAPAATPRTTKLIDASGNNLLTAERLMISAVDTLYNIE